MGTEKWRDSEPLSSAPHKLNVDPLPWGANGLLYGENRVMEIPDNFVGAKVEDGHVVIRWPVVKDPQPSSSGKTKILATTGGFMSMAEDPTKKYSINVTVPNKD